MALPIEDYAVIGDTETVALVGRNGSIDWMCVPRFDSPAAFAGLLGAARHGCWRIAPRHAVTEVTRTYRGDSLVLDTTFTTSEGRVRLTDFMPIRSHRPAVVRIVEGLEGSVPVRMDLVVRFDYGSIVPWVRAAEPTAACRLAGIDAVGGADGLTVRSSVPLEGHDLTTVAEFEVQAGQREQVLAVWHPAHEAAAQGFDPEESLDATLYWWELWSSHCGYDGEWPDEVRRSLITLKALTYAPTGGIVAAATTSLPEFLGGVRNWDYRFCWLRDATFSLHALLDAGFLAEADAWSEWLRRAVAGDPDDMQIMYGVRGERRLTELELAWLPGYESSAPVRIGNAASGQFQLDVYGEVMEMFAVAAERTGGLAPDAVDLARFLVEHVERVWSEPDDGIWEVRGPRRHFVHSKVMAWVAVDRWIAICEHRGGDVDLDHWRALRDRIHDDVSTNGWNEQVGSFTQYYGSDRLDGSLLMLGLVGFLAPDDPRLAATVDAVQRELLVDGFVLRYRTDVEHPAPADAGADAGEQDPVALAATVDGLPPGEGAFLLTTFWLVDNLVLLGRLDEARALFERLLSLRNDVGLLSEEYDVDRGRQLGNVPQAFSHIGLVNSAANLSAAAQVAKGSIHRRARRRSS
ncbi:MAG: glycoside hydrolase family 15 protein [Acidimicrobiales bacterium]